MRGKLLELSGAEFSDDSGSSGGLWLLVTFDFVQREVSFLGRLCIETAWRESSGSY